MRRTIFHALMPAVALAIVAMFCGVATAQDYDLVILGGRVMDPETKLDGVRNVGIKDGKIVTITENAVQKRLMAAIHKASKRMPIVAIRIHESGDSLNWLRVRACQVRPCYLVGKTGKIAKVIPV